MARKLPVDAECEGCGATAEDRKKNKPDSPQELTRCPFCNSWKCCMCDMGDDVECGNCHVDEDEGGLT